MYKLKITGASDDLIEIEGSTITEEFNVYLKDGERRFLAVSDGTLIGVNYDADGLWRFKLIVRGEAEFTKTEGNVAEDKNDVVLLEWVEPFKWVVLGTQKAMRA